MPSYDLIIRNATIVDGTGADRFTGDIAIAGGLIAQVGRVEGGAGAGAGVAEDGEDRGEVEVDLAELFVREPALCSAAPGVAVRACGGGELEPEGACKIAVRQTHHRSHKRAGLLPAPQCLGVPPSS